MQKRRRQKDYNRALRIGSHNYKTKLLVSGREYDIWLGMPWLVKFRTTVDYVKRAIGMTDVMKSIKASRKTEETFSCVELTNLSVEKLRDMLTKKYPSKF